MNTDHTSPVRSATLEVFSIAGEYGGDDVIVRLGSPGGSDAAALPFPANAVPEYGQKFKITWFYNGMVAMEPTR